MGSVKNEFAAFFCVCVCSSVLFVVRGAEPAGVLGVPAGTQPGQACAHAVNGAALPSGRGAAAGRAPRQPRPPRRGQRRVSSLLRLPVATEVFLMQVEYGVE